jgi:predicted ArsR family transcriptional regulator
VQERRRRAFGSLEIRQDRFLDEWHGDTGGHVDFLPGAAHGGDGWQEALRSGRPELYCQHQPILESRLHTPFVKTSWCYSGVVDGEKDHDSGALSDLASLDDPVRRRLYAHVAAQDAPVSRDDAAAAAGISRTLAAYHLDKLAEAGLLATTYARPSGRGGPGAGRPAKYYTRSGRDLAVSVPPRNYRLLADLLAQALTSEDPGQHGSSLAHAAGQTGRDVAQAAGGAGADVSAVLRDCGYEPAPAGDDAIELRNCPFDQLARRHVELVCGLNQHLLRGVLDGTGQGHAVAVLRPAANRCCVRIQGLTASGPSQGAPPPPAAR